MIRLLACLLVSLLGAPPAQAAPPQGVAEAFLQGNREYQAGNYEAAAAAYERALALGVTAPELEYNLGNAHLKAENTGRAILHYRRALRENPAFEDARVNLSHARGQVQDLVEDTKTTQGLGWVPRLRVGPEGAALLLLGAVVLWCAAAAIRIVRRPRGAGFVVLQGALTGAVLLALAAVAFERAQLQEHDAGVVVAERIEVRTGPGDGYPAAFRLHDGAEVDVLRSSGGWFEIRVSDTLQGWAPEEAVGVIQ
jgi:tetratricopeptide (TPR) repeat protein